ncbi:hypothetical protein PT274_01165 [Leuconostocaceae bacterium ESL0958]|nr:hypothetical protein [Leuconostocaceae bacterium ESL0958]
MTIRVGRAKACSFLIGEVARMALFIAIALVIVAIFVTGRRTK